MGGISSPWNFMSDLSPLHLSWNRRSSERLQERGCWGQFWAAGVQLLPHPMPADTRQDLLEPMSGESACKLLSGSSLRVGWDLRGRSEEVPQPRLLVEVRQGEAMVPAELPQAPANPAGQLLSATPTFKAAQSHSWGAASFSPTSGAMIAFSF